MKKSTKRKTGEGTLADTATPIGDIDATILVLKELMTRALKQYREIAEDLDAMREGPEECQQREKQLDEIVDRLVLFMRCMDFFEDLRQKR